MSHCIVGATCICVTGYPYTYVEWFWGVRDNALTVISRVRHCGPVTRFGRKRRLPSALATNGANLQGLLLARTTLLFLKYHIHWFPCTLIVTLLMFWAGVFQHWISA